jgi:hypothetical protein
MFANFNERAAVRGDVDVPGMGAMIVIGVILFVAAGG